ncbi:MAG: hypothetical protein ACJZ59_06935 [Candidatus Thalassarchaeaceae archaeon]
MLGECYSTVTIAGNSFSGSSQHQVCVAQRSSSGWTGVARSSSQYNPRVDAIAGHPNGGAVLWVRGDYWNRPGGGTQSLSNSDAGGLVRLHGNNRTMWLWDWPTCQGGSALVTMLNQSMCEQMGTLSLVGILLIQSHFQIAAQ